MFFAEYQASKLLSLRAHELPANPFYALLMATMREADSNDFEKLRAAFPKVHWELQARYRAPDGKLEGE